MILPFLFVLALPVQATEYIDQSQYQWQTNYNVREHSQSFVPTVSNFSGFKFYEVAGSSCSSFTVYLCSGQPQAPLSDTYACTGSGQSLINSTSTNALLTGTTTAWLNASLIVGQTYSIQMRCNQAQDLRPVFKDSNVYTNGVYCRSDQCYSNYDMRFETLTSDFPPGPLGTLNFATPNQYELVPISSAYEYTGSCAQNGLDRLLVSAYLYRYASDFPYELSDFTIDCVDNQWSYIAGTPQTVFDVSSGLLATAFVYDKDYLDSDSIYPIEAPTNGTSSAMVSFYTYYDTPGYTWFINTLYPTKVSDRNFEVQSATDFWWKFGYSTPDFEYWKNKTKFSLTEYANGYTATPTQAFISEYINVLDSAGIGVINTNVIDVDLSKKYYRATLFNATSSLLFYTYDFVVSGSNATSAPLSIDTTGDSYNCSITNLFDCLKSAFFPPLSFLQSIPPQISNALHARFPFNYYYDVIDQFKLLSVSTTSPYVLNLTATFATSSGVASFDIPFLDFTQTPINTFVNSIRPWISRALWILFALYVFVRFIQGVNYHGDDL